MTNPAEVRHSRPRKTCEDDPAHDCLSLADEALEQLQHDDHAENRSGVREHSGENAGRISGHVVDSRADNRGDSGHSRACRENRQQKSGFESGFVHVFLLRKDVN